MRIICNGAGSFLSTISNMLGSTTSNAPADTIRALQGELGGWETLAQVRGGLFCSTSLLFLEQLEVQGLWHSLPWHIVKCNIRGGGGVEP